MPFSVAEIGSMRFIIKNFLRILFNLKHFVTRYNQVHWKNVKRGEHIFAKASAKLAQPTFKIRVSTLETRFK